MIIFTTIMMGWEKGKSVIPKLKLKLLICNCDLWCCANSNSPSAAICPRAQKAQKQVALYKLCKLYELYTWLWLPSHLCPTRFHYKFLKGNFRRLQSTPTRPRRQISTEDTGTMKASRSKGKIQ